MCGMILWAAPVKVRMKFHELRHSTNTLLAALGVPENVRADILGHRTRAMTRRYTHLTVQQMRDGFQKLDAASPINVAPGVPVARAARAEVIVRALPEPRVQDAPMQPDATECSGAPDPGLTAFRRVKTKPRAPPKTRVNPGLYWSGTPGSNRRPSPWQDRSEDLQADAKEGNPAEPLALPCPSAPPDVSADAAECSGSTDPGLTRSERPLPPTIAAIADDRLLTVSEICALLRVRKSIVYGACDRGELDYVKFEGAVQIEGRDLKQWTVSAPCKPRCGATETVR